MYALIQFKPRFLATMTLDVRFLFVSFQLDLAAAVVGAMEDRLAKACGEAETETPLSRTTTNSCHLFLAWISSSHGFEKP